MQSKDNNGLEKESLLILLILLTCFSLKNYLT